MKHDRRHDGAPGESTTSLPIKVQLLMGDHGFPYAQVTIGEAMVTIYEYARSDREIIVEVDHEAEPVKVYINDLRVSK